MADLRTVGVTKLASVSLTFSATGTALLYTVPTGKSFLPVALVLHSPTGSLATATCTFGQSGAFTDFLGTQGLTNITGTTKAAILQPIPAASVAAITKYAAGTQFMVSITATANQSAACDVWGYLL